MKRPVMTTVYGVTLAGASSQILQTIKEIVEDHRTNPSKTTFSNETLHKLKSVQLTQTSYLAKRFWILLMNYLSMPNKLRNGYYKIQNGFLLHTI